MKFPTNDDECTAMGWVVYLIDCTTYCLNVSIAPDADIDGVVQAFSHSEQEMIAVNGWMWKWERVNGQ